tara:strand:- start:1192 stop:1539 length:348 start_codon:yes stop_codon:yes gene_type:complete
MGTRSNLFVEIEENNYIGVYCHYDGYPEHMLEQIKFCSHEEIHQHILIGGMRGGYRLFSPKENKSELLGDAVASYVFDPEDAVVSDWSLDYVYVKCLDGTIRWTRRADGDKWIVE